jgi:hypothetical protein
MRIIDPLRGIIRDFKVGCLRNKDVVYNVVVGYQSGRSLMYLGGCGIWMIQVPNERVCETQRRLLH